MDDRKLKLNVIGNSFLLGTLLLGMVYLCTNYSVGIVMSGSMEPTLHRNDLVIIKKSDDFKVGDMAVYESDDQLIVHRIIDIDGDEIITKGDANNVADDPVRSCDIKGVAVERVADLPLEIGKQLKAKYVAQASGSSEAEVARWDVTALDEEPDTILIMAGGMDYDGSWYEFSVNSDSETSAEYNVTVLLHEGGESIGEGILTAGLFKYDESLDDWVLVEESSSGELYYSDVMPMGWTDARFRLKVRAEDEAVSGNYTADIDVDVTQLD